MKLFWLIIAVLVAVTGVMFFSGGNGATAPSAQELIASAPHEPAPAPDPIAPPPVEPAPVRLPDVPPVAIVPEPGTAPIATPQPTSAPAALTINTIEDLNKLLGLPPSPVPTDRPAPPAPSSSSSLSDTSGRPSPPKDFVPGPGEVVIVTPPGQFPGSPTKQSEPGALASQPATTNAPASASPFALTDTVKGKFKEIVPARFSKRDDGWLIFDDRFQLRGEGTAENPFELTWDYLVSASETFQPRMGKQRMPERIAMLDGRHVRITGYVAFPIMATAANEMLSMRNMWDGCCIGVPPTPYDAVEVRLADAATGKDRFTSFGTIEGKLSVDPYIKGNWLLGLYIMDGAKLSKIKEGGDPGKHGGM